MNFNIKNIKSLASNVISYFPDFIVGSIGLSFMLVLLFRFVSPPVTYLMVKRQVSSEKNELQYEWTSYNQISPFVKVCAMASEDQNLPFHFGLDLKSIDQAVAQNRKGKKLRGASTITQQVAKNLYLWPERSYLRKLLELWFTSWIEIIWTKERILETYLNIAEMGDLIFGVEAAAQSYFKKSAQKLTLSESALIIAILPSPLRYSVKNPGAYVSNRQQQISKLFYSLDGEYYLRELYVRSDKSLYDFSKYKE